jgi:hypothetical protein
MGYTYLMTALLKKMNEIMHRLPPEQLAKLVCIAEGLEPQEPLSPPIPSGLIQEGNLLVHHGRSTLSPEETLELVRNEREELILHGK